MAEGDTRLAANRIKAARAASAVIFLLLGSAAFAADGWVMFKGQVNGPVRNPAGIDLSSFQHRRYPGIFWSEAYYHQMIFSDGSVITVQFTFNVLEATIIFAHAKSGTEPFTEFLVMDIDEVKFDDQGFGISMGRNRVWLDGKKYHLELDFNRVKARIDYDILGPSCSWGDGMIRYPDGKSFGYYVWPITRAKAGMKAGINGREYDLEGFGNMNHDAQSLSPLYAPANWQAFWFFGEDHALAIADFYTSKHFGEVLTQRLVFVDKQGNMFASSNFPIKWDDWAELKDIRFRYPRHYRLSAEGGGARLEVEAHNREYMLLKDLFGNLPGALRPVAKRFTRNGWTVDCMSDYILTYRVQGKTLTYKGLGMVRWTNLEEN